MSLDGADCQEGAFRGAAVWTVIGGTAVLFANYLYPGFRRQTLALKGLLTVSGVVFGAESALHQYETSKRSHDNLIRHKAMREIGQRGLIASESEISRWQENLIQREIERRMHTRTNEVPNV
ncbi:hypothetical protein MSPP1_003435 [Malassezia sp. CBS 17886]|nr:hypothetical protein MSPP1_003435 [Malassezia sp. CBS 17886]